MTDYLMTSAERTKLSGIETGAQIARIGPIWYTETAVASSAYGNGIRYVPLRDAQTDYIKFQFSAMATGTVSLKFLYAMSSSSASGVRFRLDRKNYAAGADQTAALTSGTAFTKTMSSDTLLHELSSSDSSDLAFSVTAGDLVRIEFYRLGTDGADAHTGDVRVIEIRGA